MFCTGLKKYETADIHNFTTNVGMRVRRYINKPLRTLLKYFIKRKVIIEQYPRLDEKKVYLFVANHSFDEDAISVIHAIDRSVYVLHGSTHQMEHNPVFYALWLNGMIYLNRLNRTSRADAIGKMERVLKYGTSIILFAEGGYNNTENQLIQPLFASPYILSQKLEIEVVPIITFNDKDDENRIYIRAGEPMQLWKYDKQEALARLRDEMSTLVYEIMLKHTKIIHRNELGNDARRDYMKLKKSVYDCLKWYEDVWEEEITYYPGHGVTTPVKAREYIDKVQVTKKNAEILSDTLIRREEDKRYDFLRYMRENAQYEK